MLLLNWFWTYSDSWHVAVNSDAKHTMHSMGVYDVGIHNMGMHDVDACSLDPLHGHAQRGLVLRGRP